MAQATRQHGVISTVELRRFGLTEKAIRWRAATGILQPLFVGVLPVRLADPARRKARGNASPDADDFRAYWCGGSVLSGTPLGAVADVALG